MAFSSYNSDGIPMDWLTSNDNPNFPRSSLEGGSLFYVEINWLKNEIKQPY